MVTELSAFDTPSFYITLPRTIQPLPKTMHVLKKTNNATCGYGMVLTVRKNLAGHCD